MSPAADPCPDDLLGVTVRSFGSDQADNLSKVESLLGDYPADARLLFLRGSLLAGLERFAEARSAMESALHAVPDYPIARFQLGFLELTSGEPARALETWRPLHRLAADHPLRLFEQGLEHLIADRFADAIDLLRQGIVRNVELEPLNRDMGLLIDRMQAAIDKPAAAEEGLSATHLLLQRYGAIHPTKH